jgi:hypothetical protein
MPLIQGRDLHVDVALSNIMIGRRPSGFIADQLLPVIPVAKQSDFYYKSNYLESIMFEQDLDTRAKGAKSREVYWSISSDNYFAKNFALGTRWFGEDVVNADDPIKYARRSARLVTDRLLMAYEMRVAALAAVSTNVGTTYSVLTGWSNTTGSRVYDDLLTIKEAFRQITTLKPNLAIIPEETMTFVRRNDQIRDILFGDRGGVATDDQIANLIGVPKILVPTIFVNSAGVRETQIGSGVKAPVWGKKAFFAYVGDVRSEEEQDTWMTAFRWTDPTFGVPFAIRAFPYDSERRSQKVEASYYQAEKIVSAELGLAINSII